MKSLSLARPRRFIVPVFGTVPLMLVLIGVARASGSGWVQIVGALVSGVMLAGVIAPYFILRKIRIQITEMPPTAQAKSPYKFKINANRVCRVVVLSPSGGHRFKRTRHFEYHSSESCIVSKTSDDYLEFTPGYLGVIESLSFEVLTAAPFGIVWWIKKWKVTLPSPILVSPHISLDSKVQFGTISKIGDTTISSRRAANTGSLRGVRSFQNGDTMRQIHWPASAHSTTLMVKELEAQVNHEVYIDLRLPNEPMLAEEIAGLVMGAISTFLTQPGNQVILRTYEKGIVSDVKISNPLAAGRAMAIAYARQ
ncbi:MAG: DUF58 domain-containing protein [Acidimicrobiales bacterium]|nr:DUF58 domain-containing protein [Acidimicrobiales bacterium]